MFSSCLPWMKWSHRFRSNVPYPLDLRDRIRNYLVGFKEIGLDTTPIYEHFGVQMVKQVEAKL